MNTVKRRAASRTGSRCAAVLPLVAALVAAGGARRLPAAPFRGPFPQFPTPKRLLIVPGTRHFGGVLVVDTLSGVLAWHDQKVPGPMIWISGGHYAIYHRWLRDWLKYHPVPVEPVAENELWSLVARLHREGLIKGYVLYRGKGDPSVNRATSLCAPLDAIAVSLRLQPQARAAGLKMVADSRGKTFAWLLRKLHGRFSRTCLGTSTYLQTTMRDEIVAANALCVLNAPKGGYRRAIALMRPGGIVFGWGIGEFHLVNLASRWGLRVVASNWSVNIPVLSAGASIARRGLHVAPARQGGEPMKFDRQRHYVAFLLSDGDNLQWLMGGFFWSHAWWLSPQRGKIPFGWGVCASGLYQADPYVLRYLFRSAKAGDDFVYYPAYFYPDRFGAARGGLKALVPALRREDTLMRRLGLHLTYQITAGNWDSPACLKTYRLEARYMPSVRAILPVQYDPYAAGRGRIIWIKRPHGAPLPFISAFSAIWRQPHNSPVMGSPRYVAALLNRWAARRNTPLNQHFAWVVVHAWSRFGSRGGRHGRNVGAYGNAVNCAKRLGPAIKVVTLDQLVEMIIRAHEAKFR